MKKLSKKIVALALASVMAISVGAGFAPAAKKVEASDTEWDYSFNLTKNQSYGTSLDEAFNVYNYNGATYEYVSHGEPSDSTMATVGYHNERNNGYLKFKQTDSSAAGKYLSTLTYMEDMKNFTAEVTYYSYMYQIAGIMIGGEAGTFPISFDSNPYNDKGVLIYLDNATEGQILNVAGAIDRATTNYLGGTTDGTDFGNHNGFSGTAGIKGKTNFTSKVFVGTKGTVQDTDPYITLVITVNDGVLSVYEKDNPENVVTVALLDSYVGGTVSLFSKHNNTSFKSFGIKALPDTEVNPNYSFDLTKNQGVGTSLNKAFNIYSYTSKPTTAETAVPASVGEPSDTTLATMGGHGTRNSGYLKLKKAGADGADTFIQTMTYLPKVTNFKAEMTYYTWQVQIAGIMFGGEKGTFPVVMDSDTTNDTGVMIFLEQRDGIGQVINIGGAIVPSTATASDGSTFTTQSHFGGSASIRGNAAFTTKGYGSGATTVEDSNQGLTLVVTVNNGWLTVQEKDSDVVVRVQLADTYEGGTVSLYSENTNTSFKAFSIEKYADPEIDPYLMKFDNLDLSTLEGWTSRIYDTETGESTPAEDITEQWFTGMDYPDKVPNWNTAFNHRNNPGLKPRVLTNEKTPYILTSANNYENFESYFTYYQHSVRYGMIIGDKESYPTEVSDSAVYVYIHGSESSGYELRVTGAVDVESGILIGIETGEILTSSDAVRLPLNQYGFAPEAASATLTTTVHVKVEDGVLTASVDDIEAKIQVNLASTYVHGGISLVSTGSAHGGFKYLRVEELEETELPEAGEASYTMSSKDEYAVVRINKEVAYSAFKADVNYDETKYEYVKAIFGNDNYRINGAGKKVLPSADGKVSVEAYSNTADTYVDLYFKTKDGTVASDFNGFSVDAEKMFAVGGKEIAQVTSSIALEQDHRKDNKVDIIDLAYAKKEVGDAEAAETREVLVGKNAVSPLFGKSALFLGDSIMNSVTDRMGWYGRLASYGMDCDEVAQDGWALTSGAGRSRIISQFQYADANKAYDFVLLEGGVNDILISEDSTSSYAANISWGDEEENITLDTTAYDDTTIAGAMQELIVETQQRYGNAKIVYIINSEFGSDAVDKTRFVTLVKKVCEVHGIEYVNLSDTDAYPELEVINDENHANFREYMVDNIHPNAKSYDLTAPIVARKMEEIFLQSKWIARVYVDSTNGNNTGDGSEENPYKSMSYAVNKVGNGGEIVIQGTYTYGTDGSIGVKGKSVTVSGGTLDLSNTETFNIKGPVTLKDLNVKVSDSGSIYANGNYFTVAESVQFDSRLGHIYGGGNKVTVDSTHMELKAGIYREIYGGGFQAEVQGDTKLYLGGNINKGIDVFANDHELAEKYCVYGGSYSHGVEGDTIIEFNGENAVAGFIYGGGNGIYASVDGTCNVTLINGQVFSLYGGSLNATEYAHRTTAAKVVMKDGKVEQIFGGSVGSNFTGDTEVLIQGGTVTRRIYGGCYNITNSDAKNINAILKPFETAEDYYVDGTATVIIENINYTHTSSLDNVISACSRNTNNHAEETGVLKFKTQALYDSLEKYIGDDSYTKSPGYDELKIGE